MKHTPAPLPYTLQNTRMLIPAGTRQPRGRLKGSDWGHGWWGVAGGGGLGEGMSDGVYEGWGCVRVRQGGGLDRLSAGGGGGQCIRREGTLEAAPEAVRWRLPSGGQWLGIGWAPWRGVTPPSNVSVGGAQTGQV